MQLAHVAYPGGPELELLIFAGALLVLSIVFFFGKVAKPSVSVGLLIGAVVVGTTSFLLGGDASAATASASIDSPSSGSLEPGRHTVTVVHVDEDHVLFELKVFARIEPRAR